MEYNNGIFLILEPGYYRIVTHLKSRNKPLEYHIIKNSHEKLIFSSIDTWRASSTSYISFLDKYDMIQVALTAQSGFVGVVADANLIQIEKLN